MTWRCAAYLWSGPTTLLGLGMALCAFAGRGTLRIVDGVIEVHGAVPRFFLRAFPPRGVAAITVGHVVLGCDPESLARTRAHERVHVKQCERWGPLFLPAYVAAGIWALLRGRHVYHDNWFERQARREALRVRSGDIR